MRLASPFGAALAVALYLFLPYGIIASQNFQPDALMTAATLWAILALVRYADDRRGARFLAAAALVGAAGVIKPMSVFLTVPALAALEYAREAPFKARVTRAIEMGFFGLLAPLIVYGYSAIEGTLVQDQMRMRFEPQLIPTAFFWGGLGRMIARVETWPILILAVLGAVVARDRLARWLLAGLFAGYFAFAVAFTYHMPTHDYYHLPYIPVAALGVGVLLARIESLVPSSVSARARAIATAVLCAATIVAGTAVAWPRMHLENAAMFEQMYEEIGAVAQHDTRALFLDTEYGFALMYHGQISGDSWPNQDDLAAEAIDGRPAIDADARFVRDYADWAPNYFIVTDLASLKAEPDLQAMLAKRAIPVRMTDRYQVYRFKSD
jgi:4-amino-4-deoxy-L-arabinose transferase-like glycosyltransferase